MPKIGDLTLDELIRFCQRRENCLECPFKKKDTCLQPKFQAEKIRRENIQLLDDEWYKLLCEKEI